MTEPQRYLTTSHRYLAITGRQDGVIAGWQCRQLGVGSDEVKARCRSGNWRRLHRGVYLVDADLAGEPAPRQLTRAALLSAGPQAVAVLDTAAAVHGIAGLPRADGRVHVNLPGPGARARRVAERSLVPHQFALDPDDVTVVDGIAVTTPLRTVTDLLLRLDRYPAVSVLDSVLHQGILDPEGLAATLPRLLAGRRGADRARRRLPEADARAASPLETRVRLRCVDAEVPPDTLQHPVYDDDGVLLGISDLAWLAPRVLVEADGAEVHGQPEAVFRDRRRQNALANAGWTVIRFTWEDTLPPGYIGSVVRRAQATGTGTNGS